MKRKVEGKVMKHKREGERVKGGGGARTNEQILSQVSIIIHICDIPASPANGQLSLSLFKTHLILVKLEAKDINECGRLTRIALKEG